MWRAVFYADVQMIVLMMCSYYCDVRDRQVTEVSHGYDTKTDRIVTMSGSENPKRELGAEWNDDMGEWVIYDKDEK